MFSAKELKTNKKERPEKLLLMMTKIRIFFPREKRKTERDKYMYSCKHTHTHTYTQPN